MTLIREMTSNHGLDSDGDVVIEAVRRAEEEEVTLFVKIITFIVKKSEDLGEEHSLHVLHWSD